MKIKKLKVFSFRNYENEEIEFSDGKNLFFGENAQGKTNLLEAVFYLSCLKTFRGIKDAETIMHGKEKACICGEFEVGGRSEEVFCEISPRGRKLIVNGIRSMRPSSHIGLIKTVVFSPDDLQLVKEGPALRRRFINIALSQLRPAYIRALSEHNRIIEQKRKILKLDDNEKYYDYIDVLNEKLAYDIDFLSRSRGQFLKKAEIFANKTMKKISGGKEKLELSYVCDSAIENTEEDNRERILKHLSIRKKAELEARSCLIGSHRDDFNILINGSSAKIYASQGQIRSIVLALKTAEKKITEEDSGDVPILLLDDVLSELDPRRREFLLSGANDGQTIITGCDPSMFSELSEGKIFTVSSGKITTQNKEKGKYVSSHR